MVDFFTALKFWHHNLKQKLKEEENVYREWKGVLLNLASYQNRSTKEYLPNQQLYEQAFCKYIYYGRGQGAYEAWWLDWVRECFKE